MKKSQDLRLCPFCGREPEIFKAGHSVLMGPEYGLKLHCKKKCQLGQLVGTLRSMVLKCGKSPAALVKWWNRRPYDKAARDSKFTRRFERAVGRYT